MFTRTVMQQVLFDHWDHVQNHGIVACSCGREVYSCSCELCAASPPCDNTIVVPDACPTCLERKRAATFGTVYELPAQDISLRRHEEIGQELRIHAVTTQVRVSEIRRLSFELDQAHGDALVTLFIPRTEADLVADAIELGADPDGPDIAFVRGRCLTCGQEKLLHGPYCISCSLDAWHDAGINTPTT